MANELVKWMQAQNELAKNITVKQLPHVKTALKIADAAIEELKTQKDFTSMRQVDMDRVWLVWRAGETVKKVQIGHGNVKFMRELQNNMIDDELGISHTDAWRWKMVACIPKDELNKKLTEWKPTERIGLNPFIKCGRLLAQKIAVNKTNSNSWQITADQKIVPCAVVITDPLNRLKDAWMANHAQGFCGK